MAVQSWPVFALAERVCTLFTVLERNRGMGEPTKLLVSAWGLSISAEGLAAIIAAVAIVSVVVFAKLGDFCHTALARGLF